MSSRCWPCLLFVLLLTACPHSGSAEPVPAVPPPAEPAAQAGLQLSFDGTALMLDGQLLPAAAQPPVPYQIFQRTDPFVVTALLAELEPCSFVLRPDPASRGGMLVEPYRNFLPQPLPGGGIALVSSPDPQTGVSSELALLAADGSAHWRSVPGSMAQLLLPALEQAPAAVDPPLAVLTWREGTPAHPYGTTPEVMLLEPAGGTGLGVERRSLGLGLDSPAAGVELLACSPDYGLLLVQNDFQGFEFIALSFAPLAIVARWPLDGQPLTSLIYPGPGYDYAGLRLDGNVASLVVYEGSAEGVIETWSFDLAAGTLAQTAYLDEMPVPADALNAADTQPGSAPYPQSILPSAGTPPWAIPAALDGTGRALLIHSDGSIAWVGAG